MRNRSWLQLLLLASSIACNGGDDPASGNELRLFLGTDNLDTAELTLIKGRCLGRLVIAPKGSAPQAAMIALGRSMADSIPADGSAPASDAELVALVPAPTAGIWQEDNGDGIQGPWLVSTTAFDWINGSGGPFADNGFEAVAGEAYQHVTEAWQLDVELVNQGSAAGARAALGAAGWDRGVEQ
jgi:hypothetical protein